MPFRSVPDVYKNVANRSGFARPSGDTAAAIVIASRRGRLGPYLIGDVNEFISEYGPVDPTWSLSGYCALAALGGDGLSNNANTPRATSQLWVNRVVGTGATYATKVVTAAAVTDESNANPLTRVWNVGELFLIYTIGPGSYANGVIKVQIANNTDGSFTISVYESNPSVPDEKWVVTRTKQLDGFGQQMYLEDRINNLATGSKKIRVRDNTGASGTPFTYAATTFTLGADGTAPADADVTTGWGAFTDSDQYPLRLLINGGFSDVTVQNYMINLAANRMDCIAILDMPSASQDSASAVTYRGTLNASDLSFGVIVTPDYQIFDRRRSQYLYVPPSGAFARACAYADRAFDIWFPPAGIDRGEVPDALLLRQNYQFSDKGVLYDAQINYISQDSAYGIYIDGNRTLTPVASALQSVHIRRLVNFILLEGAKVLKQLKFELNTPKTWDRARALINSLMIPIKRRDGVYRYSVTCDATNNTADTIDRNELYVDLAIQPVRDAEFIEFTVIVDATGVTIA